jgi:hypothetical protein
MGDAVRRWESWTKRGEREYPRILATTLNRQWPRAFLGWLAGIPHDRPSGIRTPGFSNASRETRDAAIREFLDTLRRLADQWIESGRGFSGEDPWSRNACWFSDAYQERIDRTLQKFMDRNPPPNEFGRDGRLARLEHVSHLWLPKPVAWPFQEPELEDTLARARDYAISEFQKFLASSCPQRLFRCDECGTYFVRARAPRKETTIYHGTFCEKCKHKGGARRTDSTRKHRKAQMIEWAAVYWPKWTESKGKRSEFIATQINAHINKEPDTWPNIAGNWVTRHQTEIEAEVERRNHAKG